MARALISEKELFHLTVTVFDYSGAMTAEMAAEAQKFGVRAVLEKPVSAERLIEAIRGS